MSNVVLGADAAEEFKCRAVTPEEDVLSVVDTLSRLAVHECRRAAAKLRSGFEDEHTSALLRQ
jgi:hypothetical protein